MEADWIIDRHQLRQLWQAHAEWGARRLARYVARSLTWVKKWLRGADLADETVLHSRSRARKSPPRRVGPAIVERILAMPWLNCWPHLHLGSCFED